MTPVHQTGERSFDHYARLVHRMLDVPVSTVALVEPDRQLLPGAFGLGEPYSLTRETPLSHSFCRYVVADQGPVVVSDARADPRVAGNPAIEELGVVAYAGWPIVDADGRTLGSLCAIDHAPRHWSPEDLEILEDLATACSVEMQHSQRLAQDSEVLARSIFDAAPVAMAFYDPDGHPVLANRHAADTLRGPGDVIVARALRGELREHEMEWVGPPGRQVAVVASSSQVQRSDGRLLGTLVVAQDVTELARALAVKNEFVATVSHELRTPLTTLCAGLELLGDELEDGPPLLLQTMQRMTRASTKLTQRIQQLLDMADRRNGLRPCPTDLSALVRQVQETFSDMARKQEVVLIVDAQTPQWAMVDPARIEQAVENLVSNGLKYTPPGGRVVISARGLDGTIELVVADDGIGMSSDEADQAFDAFWRAETARHLAVQGLGLGLTLVRDIAVEHRGTVRMSSEPGGGTMVVLRLPRNTTETALPG